MHMSLRARLLSLLFLLLALDTQAANVRTAGPFVGGQRGGTVTALDDGRLVAVGGGGIAIWDPAARQWTLPRDATQPQRVLHTATRVGNERIVFVGGLEARGDRYGRQTALSSVTVWDPNRNTWEVGPA